MSDSAEKVRILSALLADDLRQESTGLQSLIGIYPRRLESADTKFQVWKLVCRIEFESEEDFTGNCGFALINPRGVQMLGGPPTPVGIKKSLTNIFAFGWGPVVFNDPGTYKLNFTINEKTWTVLEFKVVLAGNDGSGPAA